MWPKLPLRILCPVTLAASIYGTKPRLHALSIEVCYFEQSIARDLSFCRTADFIHVMPSGAVKQRLSSSKRSGWNTLPWKANGEKGWLVVLAAILGTLPKYCEDVLDAMHCISPNCLHTQRPKLGPARHSRKNLQLSEMKPRVGSSDCESSESVRPQKGPAYGHTYLMNPLARQTASRFRVSLRNPLIFPNCLCSNGSAGTSVGEFSLIFNNELNATTLPTAHENYV